MEIKQFYEGKAILLTGVTGFVGKVVLEKILRSLPKFRRLYVMVRPKSRQNIQERLEKGVFSSEIFSVLA